MADLRNLALSLMEKRLEKGVSQSELAELTGIAQKTISRIENGHDTPKYETLLKIANALGYSLTIGIEKGDK